MTQALGFLGSFAAADHLLGPLCWVDGTFALIHPSRSSAAHQTPFAQQVASAAGDE
jgi:hypothetical protein